MLQEQPALGVGSSLEIWLSEPILKHVGIWRETLLKTGLFEADGELARISAAFALCASSCGTPGSLLSRMDAIVNGMTEASCAYMVDAPESRFPNVGPKHSLLWRCFDLLLDDEGTEGFDSLLSLCVEIFVSLGEKKHQHGFKSDEEPLFGLICGAIKWAEPVVSGLKRSVEAAVALLRATYGKSFQRGALSMIALLPWCDSGEHMVNWLQPEHLILLAEELASLSADDEKGFLCLCSAVQRFGPERVQEATEFF